MNLYDNICSKLLKNQKNKAQLINIKSISIQIKDIKQMKYSYLSVLKALFAKYSKISHLDEEQYITIKKKNNYSKIIISAIINSNWIIIKNKQLVSRRYLLF